MTDYQDIEARLRQAVAIGPSDDGLLWLDQRVARLLAAPRRARLSDAWQARTFGRLLLLLAAFLLLASAAAAAMGLFERTIAPIPGWTAAWDQAEVVGASQTDAGLTLTLERAYVDLNQVMVFVGIKGLEAPRPSDGVVVDQLVVREASMRDPAGRRLDESLGIDAAEPDLAVSIRAFRFDAPTTAGSYELTVTSVGYDTQTPDCGTRCLGDVIQGVWRFNFQLPGPKGTVIAADAADTVGDATLRLTVLRVTPTMVSARIAMFVGDRPVAYWHFPDATMRHGDTSYRFWEVRHVLDVAPFEEGPELDLLTNAGADDAAGTWEIEIDELDYSTGQGEAVHLAGPWKLSVTVP